MRTRDALERLAVAGRPLLADADSLVDPGEEERILEQVLASSRPVAARPPTIRSLRPALLLGAAFIAVALAAVSIEIVARGAGHHRLAGRERTIALAGYRFRLPAGYSRSSGACQPARLTPGRPMTVIYGVRAAASAEGGCLDVTLAAGSPPVPPDVAAVTVGPYTGFLVTQGPERETLYLEIPVAGGGDHYLVLSAQGLTSEQLIAVARSGLPG